MLPFRLTRVFKTIPKRNLMLSNRIAKGNGVGINKPMIMNSQLFIIHHFRHFSKFPRFYDDSTSDIDKKIVKSTKHDDSISDSDVKSAINNPNYSNSNKKIVKNDQSDDENELSFVQSILALFLTLLFGPTIVITGLAILMKGCELAFWIFNF